MTMASVDTVPLEEQFGERMVRPGDREYDRRRAVFNGMIDRRPALILCCASTDDVVAAVEFARDSDLDVAVRSGGHAVTGHGTVDDGIVIDLRDLNAIEVYAERRIARVGGGATWGPVDAATQEHGLAVTGGRVPGTGVAGLTLGSGSGWIERKYGLTCDSLLSCEVVTAAGEVVTASETENKELFWGLRGGGGNFGIVTEFQFQLHPVGPLIYGGMLMHPAERGVELLRMFRDFMAEAPDEINAAVAFVSAPPEDFVPEPVRGQPVVGLLVSYTGDPEEGKRALAPLVGWGPPAVAMIQTMPYVALQGLLEPGNPEGLRNYWAADFIELPDEACEVFARFGNARPSPMSQAIVIPGGGAIARVDDGAMAFGQRGAPFNCHILTMWADPADDDTCISFAREFGAAMKPFGRGGAYLNFIGEEGGSRVREAFGPDKYARLQALKQQWDPTNLFHLNQNVPPPDGAVRPS
jgi:FAD/FMN-containing dehydrogenase